MSNPEEKSFAGIVAVAAIVITIVALYFIMTMSSPPKPVAGQSNTVSDKAQIGGEFSLTNQDDHPFGTAQLKGKPSLLYFGFTFCPDICPTSLQKLSTVIDMLDKYNIEITPVFITIDPKRDTPSSLKAYLKHFNPKFVGLTGTEEAIKEVADKFKVYYSIAPVSDPTSAHYLLDHTSLVYLLDREGNFVMHFHIDSSAQETVDYIVKNKGSL